MKRTHERLAVLAAIGLIVFAVAACHEPDTPGTSGSPKDWNTMWTGTDTSGGTANNGGVARNDAATPGALTATVAPTVPTTAPVTTTTATTTVAPVAAPPAATATH